MRFENIEVVQSKGDELKDNYLEEDELGIIDPRNISQSTPEFLGM